ncbi:hypothetical protein KUTeg_022360 [Tegillarca granosa]|uniref:Impact N-terminal domain-containing protein n=1 Tax=Tegillarca granosa TaxID=220873 RepID=A0ABQ9E8U0_TEGGR|nr:hypothetical protein KUTeg_022360 [Tegillarca granosa]
MIVTDGKTQKQKKRNFRRSVSSSPGNINSINTGIHTGVVDTSVNTDHTDIKQSLAAVINRIDAHESKIESLENRMAIVNNDIYDRNGIRETLDSMMTESNEHTCDILKLTEENTKVNNELKLIRGYVTKLEQKIEIQQNQITDLQGRSTKDNIVVTGLVETDRENLPRILKNKNSKIRINPHFPEVVREKRKRLFEIQAQLNKQNVDTKVYGDKLVYKQSGTVLREKVALPKASDVFKTALYIKNKHRFASGDTFAENGKLIMGRAMSVSSIQDVREGISELLTIPAVAASTHNIVAYRFTDIQGVIHDGIEDDGEHGGVLSILKCMKEEGFNNVLVVVSRTFGQKLGSKRFTYFKAAARTAIQKVGNGTAK